MGTRPSSHLEWNADKIVTIAKPITDLLGSFNTDPTTMCVLLSNNTSEPTFYQIKEMHPCLPQTQYKVQSMSTINRPNQIWYHAKSCAVSPFLIRFFGADFAFCHKCHSILYAPIAHNHDLDSKPSPM